jgi:DNA-binding XRE family transcriptional regulator
MKITPQFTDEGILRELGARLAGVRLGHNLTQAALAEQAGVSKRTVERLESGGALRDAGAGTGGESDGAIEAARPEAPAGHRQTSGVRGAEEVDLG